MDPVAIAAMGLCTAEALSKIPKPIATLFPGIAEWSISRAKMGVRRRALDEVGMIREKALEAGLSEETVDRLCANVLRDATGDDNFLSVAVFASEFVEEDADASKVNPNWAATFRAHAEKVYDEEARRTWGMLLAGELNSPGSFSKRTMSILADMSGEDALNFEHACSLLVSTVKENRHSLTMVLEIDEGGTSFNNGAVPFGTLSYLETLGLLSSMSINYTVTANGTIGFWYGAGLDKAIIIKNGTNDEKRLKFGEFQLTPCGEQLASLCQIGTSPNVAKYIKRLGVKQGFDFFDLPLPTNG